MEKKYTIGIDFGTLSGRAVLVNVANGHVETSAVRAYTHGVMEAMPDGTALPDTWALQHPQQMNRMGKSAREDVLDTYKIEKTMSSFLEMMDGMFGKNR